MNGVAGPQHPEDDLQSHESVPVVASNTPGAANASTTNAHDTETVNVHAVSQQTHAVTGTDAMDAMDNIEIKEEGKEVSQAQSVEVTEHVPEGSGSVTDATEESSEMVADTDHELKRVKVYELIGTQWVDRGTAFCFGHYEEESNEALLIARAERNYDDIILTTTIRSSDVYQRQQDTLIVWTEPNGVDYALSFQDSEGCAEVWNFILEVQQHISNSEEAGRTATTPLLSPDVSVTTASIIRSGHLPTPQLGIISEIERAIRALARSTPVRESICEYIQHEEYIKSLIEVMHTAEDLESLENLHALCSLMRTILLLNDLRLYEHVLDDDMFLGVVGMLEYDPDFPNHKANYREFLSQHSNFHQPIVIRDNVIRRKIHHTYRLQFLKDVVLARALDDSTFNVLNSCIIFNQIDIISHVQQDQWFLRDIVRLFVDEELLNEGGGLKQRGPGQGHQTHFGPQPQPPLQPHHMVISLSGDELTDGTRETVDVEVEEKSSPPLKQTRPEQVTSKSTRYAPELNGNSKLPGFYAFAPPDGLSEEDVNQRREVVILIQQLCIMGKNVQVATRLALFRTLVDRGILFAVQWALSLPETDPMNKPILSAAGEVLSALLDHDINGVRGHVLKQIGAIEKEREAKKRGAEKAVTILELVCRIMAQSQDVAVQSQVGDALKVWLDIRPPDVNMNTGGTGEANVGLKPNLRKDEPGKERHMDYFYQDCAQILLKPLHELPEWEDVKDRILPLSREETNRSVCLCELLHNFILQHTYRSLFYIMTSDIFNRVASLLKAKDKHLRHSALRIFRLLLRLNNANTIQLMLKYDVLKPILDLTIQESRRNNLLSCSCQEFFEHMRRENTKDMIKQCMTKHETEIRLLARSPLWSQRFELIIRRYEMNSEVHDTQRNTEKPVDIRWPDQGRAQDAEEEDYFNADDDDDVTSPISSQKLLRGSGAASPLLKRKRRISIGSAHKGHRPQIRVPSLTPLVDYEEEEDDDDISRRGQNDLPPSSPKLTHRQVLAPSSGPPQRHGTQEEDEEDNLLEALMQLPSKSPFSVRGRAPQRLSEKRRRSGEDEDDELLERLRKSKKQDVGPKKEGASASLSKPKDDSPKKIKVKFGTTGLSLVSSSASSATTHSPSAVQLPEMGAKDGDTG